MIFSIVGCILIALGILAVALQRFYSSMPSHELKRLAGRHDHLAKTLYRPVAFGASLRVLLWMVAGLSIAGGVLAVSLHTPWWAALLISALVLLVTFVWVPSGQLTVTWAGMAGKFAPALAAILHYIHRPLDVAGRWVGGMRELESHSGIYEKSDLAALIEQQKDQADNRIGLNDLALAYRSLHFTDRPVSDVLLSRDKVKLVSSEETVGPVLLKELHDSGQQSFLIYTDKPENVIGTMKLSDAVAAKQGGRVMDLVRADIGYVRDDFSLRQTLEAFTQTRHYLLVVIDNFGDFLGVVSLDDLLGELLGEERSDFLSYEDKRAVAAYRQPEARPDDADEAPIPSTEATEVVE